MIWCSEQQCYQESLLEDRMFMCWMLLQSLVYESHLESNILCPYGRKIGNIYLSSLYRIGITQIKLNKASFGASGCHSLLQGDLPDPGIELTSPALQSGSLLLSYQGSPKGNHSLSFILAHSSTPFHISLMIGREGNPHDTQGRWNLKYSVSWGKETFNT